MKRLTILLVLLCALAVAQTPDSPEPSEVSSDVLQFQALLADAFKPQNEMMAEMLKIMQQQAAELKALREQVGKMKGCKEEKQP